MVPDADTIEWLLPGACPEVARVRFSFSTDAGATWTVLGDGTRTETGWELDGLDLPDEVTVRGQAIVSNGGRGESLMEAVMSFPMPSFTVQFDLGEHGTHVGGGELTQSVSYGGSADAPHVTTGEGREHVGWDRALDRITGDITVNALYEEGYRVAFSLDGIGERIGGGDLVQVVPHGGSAIAPSVQSLGNWIFMGWSERFDAVNARMEIWAQYRPAIPGEHDAAFDPETGGTVNTIALQPDGRILLGGWFSSIDGQTRNRIARLHPDGSLDMDFHPNATSTVEALLVQADGKILVAGWFTSMDGVTRNRIARLNPDGSVDADFNPNANGIVHTLAVQPDGKILVGGSFSTMDGVTRNRIARLHPDGSLDFGFNPNADGEVVALVLQPDGKILIGGAFTQIGGSFRAYMARINSDGTLDDAFSPNVEMINTWNPLGVEAIALRPDGKIYAGGDVRFIEGETRRSYLARLNEDGSLDLDFYMPPRGAHIDQIALLADGRILCGADGGSSYGAIAITHLFLLNENGSIDASFDRHPIWYIKALGLQPTGRLLIAGSLRDGENEVQANLLRLYVDEARSHLTVPGADRIEWLCGGAHPEALRVTFDLSTDGGESWSHLGAGTRSETGWRLEGIELPDDGTIRGRAVVSHGGHGESLLEQIVSFPMSERTVQFDPGEQGTHVGGGPLTQTILSGGAAIEPEIESLSGWAHVGWDTPFNHVTGDRTVTARYLPIHSVTFDLAGKGERIGGGELSQSVIQGRSAEAPDVEGFDLHVLGGWDRAFDPVSEDLIVTAWYHPPRTVTFDLAGQGEHTGGGDLTQVLPHGASATEPLVHPHEGLAFIGWDAEFDSVQSDKTVTARYRTPLAGDTTVFNPNVNGTVQAMVQAMALQPDGKILVGGSWGFTSVDGVTRNRIARLNPDGTLDSGFNPNASSQVETLAVQPDGKIILGGWFSSIGGVERKYIARLYPDGTLDTDFNPNVNNTLYTVAVQSDGKIVIGGNFTGIDGQTRNRIARLNPDGSLDMDFDPNAGGTVEALLVQADGNILVGGWFTSMDGVTRNRIARLNPDGSVDADFNPNANEVVKTLAVQPDGKILAGGNFSSMGGQRRSNLARLQPDGTIDASFNPNAGGTVHTLAVQADGMILVGGYFTSMGGQTRNRIARLHPDGSLNNGFNPDANGTVYSLLVQADGRILSGGEFTRLGGTTRNRIAQFHNHEASDDLSVPGAARVLWSVHGAFPEADRVDVDLSIDEGGSWTALGSAVRSLEGWELAGIDLPANGTIRARAVVTDGGRGSGLIERLVHFSFPSYAVSFDLDGKGERIGGGELTQTILQGGAATEPEVQVLDGFAHVGWDVAFDEVRASLTVVAQYLPIHTVTFDLDGIGERTGGGELTQTILHGGAAAAPGVQGSGLFVFGGWDMAFNPVTADLTVTAWYHPPRMVTFDLDGKGERTGGGELMQMVAQGSGASAPMVQAYDGWAFTGWDTTFNAVLADKVVTAQYRKVPAPGSLSDFNPNGSATVWTLAIQADGKILIGGGFTSIGGVTRNRIARLNPDGTLDTTFNPNANDWVRTLAVQADGKILVGGQFTSMGGVTRNRIARLHPNGSLDTGFNPNANGALNTLAVQADGKILVGGSFSSIGGQTRNRIARLNPDGTVDTGFNPNATSSVETMALQPDGKILVGGQFSMIAGQSLKRIARLNPEGTLDISFNPNPSGYVYALVPQADGKVLVGGDFTSMGGVTRNRIARLNPDGTLDTGFNPNAGNQVFTIAAQSDGKILVGGSFTTMGGQTRNRIARLNPDGTLDTSFNPNAGGTVYSLILQGDGNILAGGGFTSMGGYTRNRIARLYNDDAIDQLLVPGAARLRWQCGAAFPEAYRVDVDLSINDGESWTGIGRGVRVAEGWELAGLNLPATGKIRARANVSDGGKSSGFVERVEEFNLPEYSVVFDLGMQGAHSGGGALSQMVAFEGAAIAPHVHALEGFAHVGWDTAFDEVTDDLTVTALYQPVYTVTFEPGAHGEHIGGGELNQTLIHGNAADAPDIRAAAGWGFAGWDRSFDSVTGNLTVSARYFTLDWSAIGNTHWRNQPVSLTLTAKDQQGLPFTDFEGPVEISLEMEVPRPETRQVGTETAVWNYPMSTYYHDARTQVIYLAEELGGVGAIRSLALEINGVPGITLGNWTIRMRHTSLNEYSDDPQWESEWTTVYRRDTRIQNVGWVVFDLETPFAYNGIDNLMVDFSHENDHYANDGFCTASNLGALRTLTFRTDSLHGEPLAWSGAASGPAPETNSRVPNVRFGGEWVQYLTLSVYPTEASDFENGVWSGTVAIGEQGVGGRLVATAADGSRWESEVFEVRQHVPDSFGQWLADENLSGVASELFRKICPERGIAHGFRYAFGANLSPERPLLNIRMANGRPVVETPAQDASTLPHVDVHLRGSRDLIDWNLPIRPAVDTTGKPADCDWHEPDGGLPDKAFFRIEVNLK